MGWAALVFRRPLGSLTPNRAVPGGRFDQRDAERAAATTEIGARNLARLGWHWLRAW